MDFLRGYSAFLKYQYWFNPNPVPLGPSLVSQILAFFGFFVVAAIALRVAAHVFRKKDVLRADILKRFARLLAWTGVLGLLALFVAYEQVPFFGMRFWFLPIFALFLIWLGRIAWFVVRDHPLRRRMAEERTQMEKYLPKKR